MAPRIRPLTPAEMSDRQRALYESIAGGPRARGPQHFALTAPDGSLRGPFDAMLRSPELGTALQELGAAIRYRTSLDDRGREMAILLVAAHWSSDFEQQSHEAIARAVGFTERELEALRGSDLGPFTQADAALGEAVLGLLAGDLDDEAWGSANAALGEETLFELATLVGYYSTLALQLRVFRVAA